LDFPDSTFDLVNARFIGGVLLIEHWPPFLSECLRVAKPGALLRLTEAEDSHSTSEAEERLGAAFYQALYRVRRSFSPTGRRLNLLPILRKLLQNAGFQLLRQHASVLDYSAGTPLHKDWCDNMNISLHLLKPFLVSQAKLFSSAEFDALCQQFQEEQATQEYYALTFLLTTLARKPLV
jgi:hypothetical protein